MKNTVSHGGGPGNAALIVALLTDSPVTVRVDTIMVNVIFFFLPLKLKHYKYSKIMKIEKLYASGKKQTTQPLAASSFTILITLFSFLSLKIL